MDRTNGRTHSDRHPSVLDRFRLDDKVCVVTGASKNIGFEISRAFADVGAVVVMVARGAELLATRANDLRSFGANVVTIAADVSEKAGCDKIAEVIHGQFPQVDVLVNNAFNSGDTHDTEPLSIPDSTWENVLATNLMGPYRLAATLGDRMRSGRGGSIINILSGSGFLPSPGSMPYGVSKAGLWMMTRYLAAACAPTIRVNALVPGTILSDTGGPKMGPRIQELFLPMIPMGRTGDPAEVAPAAVYLASDASTYTTGTVLFVNGGRPW
jgi:NAD(P)-dependent dehydrogenase (short-subunit alcohol dehydrogenase family)